MSAGRSGAILVGAIAAGLLVAATAQAQTRTCTQAYQECVTQLGDAGRCAGARARCLKTGRWVGPKTGQDRGRHIRK